MDKKIKWNMCKSYYWNRVTELGWHKNRAINSICNLWIALWRYRKTIRMILEGKFFYVKQVELVLTTKCTLRCKECANLMQYYNRPYDIEVDSVCKAIKNLLNKVDEIDTVVLVGGEPLLYKNLHIVVEELIRERKVKAVDIYTNGSIVPAESVLAILRNSKCKLIISDYGKISGKKHDLVKACKTRKIKYHLKNKDLHWGYVGNMECRNRKERQLKKQFRKCGNPCRSILNGKLFYCPRASHGDDLGYAVAKKGEYVNLLNAGVSAEEIMRILYSSHYFTACNYCNYGTKDLVSIVPGEQLICAKTGATNN